MVAASTDRLSTVDLDDGDGRGSIDLAGIADLAPGGSGSALRGDRRSPWPTRARSPRRSPHPRSARRRRLRSRLAAASPGTTVVLGDPGDRRHARPRRGRDRRRHAARRPRRHRRRGSRSRPATASSFIDPRPARSSSTIAARRRRPRPGHGHRHRRPEAVRDRRRRRRRRATTSSRSAVTRPRTAPVDHGRTRCRARARGSPIDEASQMVHILGLRPGRDAPPGRGPSTSSSPTATRSLPTPGCRTASSPAAWALDVEPDVPDRRPPAAPRVRRAPGRRRRSTSARTPSPGACPGVIAGALMAGLLYLLARILFRRRLSPARRRCSSSSTGCSSSSRGSG